MLNTVKHVIPMLVFAFACLRVDGGTQYWDISGSAGIQGGNGNWNTNVANWSDSSVGTTLSPWSSGNDAVFVVPSNGVASVITASNSFNVSSLTFSGSGYTLLVTNGGGLLQGGNGTTVGNGAGNNTFQIIGGAGVTSSWDSGGAGLVVGTVSGGTNNLVVVNGAGVEGSAVATNLNSISVGGNSGAHGNSMIISNNAWVIQSAGSVAIGSNYGNSNSLVVARGGKLRLASGGSIIIGDALGAGTTPYGNQFIARDAGTFVDLGGKAVYISYQYSAAANTMQILDGAVVSNGFVLMGYGTACPYSLFVVSNAQFYCRGGNLEVGFGSGGTLQTAIVTGASAIWEGGSNSIIIGKNSYASNTVMIISDGALVSNTTVNVGYGSTMACHDNILIVTNGGRLYSRTAYIGVYYGPMSNAVLVTGTNSLWSLGGNAIGVGGGYLGFSTNSMLTIANGAVVTNVGQVNLPGFLGQLNITNGGRLYSSGACKIGLVYMSNSVSVSGNGSVWSMNGGTLSLGPLAVSNNYLAIDKGGVVDSIGFLGVASNNYVRLLGGTLEVAAMGYTNGWPLTAGDGSQSAVLRGLGGPLNSSNGIVIQTKAELQGYGAINGGPQGLSFTNGATLQPGVATGTLAYGIGSLTNIGACAFAPSATIRFEIATNTAPGVGWDQLVVTNGVLALGGVLKPVLCTDYRPDFTHSFAIMTNRQPNNITNTFFNTLAAERVNVYNTNMLKVLGTLRVGISNQYVVLDSYRPHAGGMLLFVR